MRNKFIYYLIAIVLTIIVGEAAFFVYLTRKKERETLLMPELVQPKLDQNGEKNDLPIVLVNQHPEYVMEVNSFFSQEEQKALVNKYGKEKIIFHLVGSEDQVPWDGATQRGREFDGERNVPMNMMMAIYKGNTVEYYLYPYPENYRDLGEKKLSVLSGVVSYKLIEALAAKDRGYLVEAQPAPKIPMNQIEKYCMDNPLVIVKQR